ncbi:glycosyl hydrolase [Flavobacterium azooxidireducens]|uniref:Glycosyl hydrolase n=1 Tax=Flavobacterium azooxidireducens TaxID=1871076 RepID=A0ABY4KKL0_9FLAO|nr:sialidase family protein [Flavobacterium azooxidireducens]UPQ80308.1 glycosyl hydrolase [Flavobacterium azooxidireducens]
MRKECICFVWFLFAVTFSWAQNENGFKENSLVKNIAFQSVGPTVMSGRVVDVDVNPNNPIEFYVAYASGGLWYSNNNGMSFEPVMDSSPTQNIGEIAVDWKTGTIWVGTGEHNASRSSYAGIGILKSSDKGKTWKNMGLTDSHHIGKIEINPNNSNEIVVGVTGHLYSKNTERGIYKSTDGGNSWRQTLYIDDETGIIDISVSPTNFNIQYAAAWKKDRKAWNFLGNGTTSGIYKSEDGGNSWKLISTPESGFPTGDGVGRIGLAAFDDNTIYALLDNQNNRPSTASKNTTLPTMFSVPGDVFMQIPDKEVNSYLKKRGHTEKYRAQNLKNLVKDGAMKPEEVKSLLLDANAALFETEVIGAEVYKSTDGGKTWKKTHTDFIDDFYYSYGYYFGRIAVDSNNSDKIYLSGVPVLKSDDGGKSFVSINRENVHVDHHIVWVNPKKPGHLINGNDGGLNISYDDGANWIKCNPHGVSQFYSVSVDYQKPYNIYGGMQDNGVWVGPSNYKYNVEWHQEGKYPFESLMGGDGMQTQIDRRNADIVFTGFQFGNYYRIDRSKKEMKYISPKAKKDEKPLRFNWQTPILLSSHNQDILYMGSQYLHRSFDQGETWSPISSDLTQGGKEGNVAYGTLTTISESKQQFGVIYAGSDDGLVHISKDGGVNWQNISTTFPKDLWVSRVVASTHKNDRVYVTLNGYRWDDFKPYVYFSDDYGQTWNSIAPKFETLSVNVLVEDNVNPNILYLGSDNGVYISFDQGKNWQTFNNGMPPVAVHDMVIQTEANDLVVGTHGRSIYKVNLKSIQQLNEETLASDLKIFSVDNLAHSDFWGSTWSKWLPANEPKIDVDYYAKNKGEVTIQVIHENGIVVFEDKQTASIGINQWNYDVEISKSGIEKWKKKDKKVTLTESKNGKTYLIPGKYQIKITQGKISQSTPFEIAQNERNKKE